MPNASEDVQRYVEEAKSQNISLAQYCRNHNLNVRHVYSRIYYVRQKSKPIKIIPVLPDSSESIEVTITKVKLSSVEEVNELLEKL